MRKKGVLFTIVVIIFVAVIIILAQSRFRTTITDKQQRYESRIITMNDFLLSFHQDAERAIYISAFRTFIALEDYVSKKAVFLNNTDYYFQQIFYNGTIEDDNTTFEIMNASTFYDYQRKVNEIAGDVNLGFDSEVDQISLSMRDPWTATVQVTIRVNLTDRAGVASFFQNTTISADIPIIDLRDPLYSARTQGKLPTQVKKTNITLFVNDTGNINDTSLLQYHLNHSLYINSSRAPNFLMRFENNLSPDVNGIESLVNLQVLADQGYIISDNNRSVVDYIYFGESDTDNYCNIQNMIFPPENWFIIDKAHSEIYQVNTTLTHTNC
jgi:hypothetical protein